VPSEQLKSYQEALAQYHLHPELTFHNVDYLDSDVTSTRHIIATAVEHIGKEANRWEEQLYLGLDLEAQAEYGTAPYEHERILEVLVRAGQKFGQRKPATAAGVSLSEVSEVLLRKRRPTSAMLARLYRAVSRLDSAASEEAEHVREVLDVLRRRCRLVGVREFARQAGVYSANFAKLLSGRREPSPMMLAKLEAAFRIRSWEFAPPFHRRVTDQRYSPCISVWSGSQDVEIHCLSLRRRGHAELLRQQASATLVDT
jgi:transcriptional regulator with XRE-family HTH domain